MQRANLEILNLFERYLDNKLSLGAFQQQIALAHWNIESTAPSLSELVYQAVGKLSEFSRSDRSEASLRQALAAALLECSERTAPHRT